MELLQHDSETLRSSSDLSIIETGVDVDGPRLSILNSDEIDGGEKSDLNRPTTNLLSAEEPEGSKVLDELIVLVYDDDIVVDGELVPFCGREAKGRGEGRRC